MNGPQPGQGWASLLPFVIVGLVLLLRLRRAGKAHPLRVGLLWIVPAIYGVFAALLLYAVPPHGWQWAACLAALAVGSVAGWLRGRSMKIAVDPASGKVLVMPTLTSMVFLVVLILIRQGFRSEFAGDPHAAKTTAMVVVDALVCFAVGLLGVSRLEMGLRARRLLRG